MSADVHQLAKMLHELDDQMVSCMKCGLCQAVCPVFAETMNEGDVARGKIALLENLAKEMIADAGGVQKKLNMCLLCGSCAANCPSGVKVLDIFLKARVIVNTYMGLPAAKKAIFQGLLTKPALFNSVLDVASRFQGFLPNRPAILLAHRVHASMRPSLVNATSCPWLKSRCASWKSRAIPGPEKVGTGLPFSLAA